MQVVLVEIGDRPGVVQGQLLARGCRRPMPARPRRRADVAPRAHGLGDHPNGVLRLDEAQWHFELPGKRGDTDSLDCRQPVWTANLARVRSAGEQGATGRRPALQRPNAPRARTSACSSCISAGKRELARRPAGPAWRGRGRALRRAHQCPRRAVAARGARATAGRRCRTRAWRRRSARSSPAGPGAAGELQRAAAQLVKPQPPERDEQLIAPERARSRAARGARTVARSVARGSMRGRRGRPGPVGAAGALDPVAVGLQRFGAAVRRSWELRGPGVCAGERWGPVRVGSGRARARIGCEGVLGVVER